MSRSPHYRSFVLRYHHRQAQLLAAAAVIALIGLLGLAYFVGTTRATPYIDGPEAFRELSVRFESATLEIEQLRGELVVQSVRHDVDRETLEILRRDIAAQQEQTADLEEGLKFYKSLMAPGEIAQGFSLRDIELVGREGERRYAFRIVAQQESRKHQTLKGELSARVFGVMGDADASYALAELSDDLDEEQLPLRFRYFQAIEGVLTLPEGFEPRGVRVVATVSSPRKTEVREQFAWQVQERFTHVGK